jgi:hypothetical protein
MKASGIVEKLLADDVKGAKHQRFIVKLKSGKTVLIVHNIDIAAKVVGLNKGDRIEFKGKYIWNSSGGLVHWTHKDPSGHHQKGWIKVKGKTFQ